MAALLDFLGVRTIERTGAASSQAVVLGRADGSGNRPRTGHQPTSRQQNQTEGDPETEGVAERVALRAFQAYRVAGGQAGCKILGSVHII